MNAVDIAIRLRGAAKYVADASKAAAATLRIGSAASAAAAAAKAMGGAFFGAADVATRAMGAAANQAKYLSIGVGAVAIAGVKMGLSFNAQVESARLRFSLFTSDVAGLEKAVQKIDMSSAFGFGDLSDAAAMFGNSGVKDIPNVLQGAANAAAASGKGVESLKSIVTALSQIQSKGKLSQEEINQLNEAGAPGAQKIIADHFKLTAKELGNLGGQGLDATEAIEALTSAWTSGKMAKAAEAQTKTLGGQWNLLTGNIQKLSGAATESLAAGLRDTALPAINAATQKITEIFGREGLSNEQKLAAARKVIIREIGPVWEDLVHELDEADIPDKLGKAVAAAMPKMLDAMTEIAPKAAKAFIDGWMASGPEVKVLTGLFLANKLRKSSFGDALFGGKGGGGKGGGGWFTPAVRGSTPLTPVFVTVVGGQPYQPKKFPKVPPILPAGGVGAGALATAGVGVGIAGLLGYVAWKNAHNDNETRGATPVARANAGTIQAPGFGTGTPGALNVHATFNVDGKTVSRTTATTDAIEQGRLAASRAAGG